MKKIFIYSVSALSVICMLHGFLKKENLVTLGLYSHFIEMACISLGEYEDSKKFTFKTIYYPIILVVLIVDIIY